MGVLEDLVEEVKALREEVKTLQRLAALNRTPIASNVAEFELPKEGYVRLEQIVGNAKKGILPVIPVSKSTWWEGVQTGRFPKPIKLTKSTTVWRVEDIRALYYSDCA